MHFDRTMRWRLRLQSGLFVLLLLLAMGLLAWLSNRYLMQADWTASGRNSLSVTSQLLLERLQGPLRVTAYVRDTTPVLREAISRLMERYQRHKPDVELRFVNPDSLPEQVRALGITAEGELYLEYRGRGEHVRQLNEQALAGTLQRLSRPARRVVHFLAGQGERAPQGIANHDMGAFGRELEKAGIDARPFNPVETPQPVDGAALVIASPRLPLPPVALRAVLDYLAQGGNLLWLLEPNDPSALQPLAEALGLTIRPGMLLNRVANLPGIANPAVLLIADYGPHPITAALRASTLLPEAAALDWHPIDGWMMDVLLESPARTETDDSAAARTGLSVLGLALSRPHPVSGSGAERVPAQQRLVIIGDGDFLSNTYLGNGANLELGLNIMNWLTLDDTLVAIPPHVAPDRQLDLSETALALLAGLFLFGLPGALLAGGVWMVWRRR